MAAGVVQMLGLPIINYVPAAVIAPGCNRPLINSTDGLDMYHFLYKQFKRKHRGPDEEVLLLEVDGEEEFGASS